MPKLFLILVAVFVCSCAGRQEARWKTVDEGFLVTVPSDFRKKKVEGIDSIVGQYRGKTMDLSYDRVSELSFTMEDASEAADKLRALKVEPDTWARGEEVWVLDGKFAQFQGGKLRPDSKRDRKYRNFAEVFVPFEGSGGSLSVRVLYRDEGDDAIARHILKGIRWKE